MKKSVKLLAVVLVFAVLLVFLASCDKSESIVGAYEKAGYEVYTGGVGNSRMDDFRAYTGWDREDIDDLDDYQLIFCYEDGVPAALIVNYMSKHEMKDHLIQEEDGRIIDDEAYRLADEAGLLKNNCQLVFAKDEAALAVFASAE